MPHFNKFFDKPYIGHWDLEGDTTLTIERIEEVQIRTKDGEVETKPLIYFAEAKKGMVTNSTNCKTIASIYGSPRTEDWIGKQITLYSTQCDAFGKTTDCIRIRPTRPDDAKTKKESAA